MGYKETRYGAMISDNYQDKRVEWCKERIQSGDTDFDKDIFSKECTVQLESNRRITLYKKGQPIRYKMKAKHPPKFIVWAGTSLCGATKVVVLTRILTAI